jgi:hypothetical protein
MKAWIGVMVALLVIGFSGCASFPTKGTADDSLIVIKTEIVNSENLPRGYEIVFHYSGGYPDSWVGEYSWTFSAVKVREQGVTLQSLSMQISGRFRGDEPTYPVNMPLPYEPGRVAIADFVFVHRIQSAGTSGGQQSNLEFRKITQQEKDDLMQTLTADGRFASWMQ